MSRRRADTVDRVATVVLYAAGLFVVVVLALFIGYLLVVGRGSLNLRFLTSPPRFMQAGGGIGPQLYNSLCLLVISLALSLPVGLMAGVFLAEYAKPGRLVNTITLALETLSSLPSIIVGLFGLLIFVHWWGFSLISGALALMVLNLPVITRVSEEAVRSVPGSIREGSLGLGATKWQTITRLLLPAAIPQLVSGVVLVAGRVFGEAAALLYTAGMSGPAVDFHDANPLHPSSFLNALRPAETLAVYIWKVNSEGLAPDARKIADGAAAVLVIVVCLFNIAARALGRYLHGKSSAA